MRFKTLIAVAVAGAFAVPFAALAQGTGGTTTAPSATHPQGNPPASATPGSQKDEAATSTTDSKRAKNAKNKADKEDKNARRSDDTGAGSTSSGTTGSGAGNMGSGSSGSTMGTPKSPSSGGEPQSGGATTSPKGAN